MVKGGSFNQKFKKLNGQDGSFKKIQIVELSKK